jgi:hypothetical protein
MRKEASFPSPVFSLIDVNAKPDDDDDVYLRLQHGKGFHNLVYMSYVKHIDPAKRHK